MITIKLLEVFSVIEVVIIYYNSLQYQIAFNNRKVQFCVIWCFQSSTCSCFLQSFPKFFKYCLILCFIYHDYLEIIFYT